jgi:hypothetical protein
MNEIIRITEVQNSGIPKPLVRGNNIVISELNDSTFETKFHRFPYGVCEDSGLNINLNKCIAWK